MRFLQLRIRSTKVDALKLCAVHLVNPKRVAVFVCTIRGSNHTPHAIVR